MTVFIEANLVNCNCKSVTESENFNFDVILLGTILNEFV